MKRSKRRKRSKIKRRKHTYPLELGILFYVSFVSKFPLFCKKIYYAFSDSVLHEIFKNAMQNERLTYCKERILKFSRITLANWVKEILYFESNIMSN